MPAKSTSPEAAQNKLRRAEIKDLEKARRHVLKSVDDEIRAADRMRALAFKDHAKAAKALESANKKYDRLCARLEKSQNRDLGQIERRIAILGGRTGAN